MLRSLRAAISLAAASIVLTGCLAPAPTLPAVSATPLMRPEAFFAGRTEGRGELTLRGRAPRSMKVESQGHAEADGGFRLEQTLTFEDGHRHTRTWHMRRVDGRTYTGTLSDAAGEFTGDIVGNRLHLRYLLRRPLSAGWLVLA